MSPLVTLMNEPIELEIALADVVLTSGLLAVRALGPWCGAVVCI